MFAKQAEIIALELSEKDENTGETILHVLAKEGKVGIIKHLLKNDKISDDIVRLLLSPDYLGWTPIMSAIKADRGTKEIIDMFLEFLLEHMKSNQLEELFQAHKDHRALLVTEDILIP